MNRTNRRVFASDPGLEEQDGRPVKQLPPRPHIAVGKAPRKHPSAGRIKMAYTGGMGNTIGSSGGNWYSPELSTDFLELPQSKAEQWAYFRFFYRTNPFVGQAIDLHTELPLSRVRLNMPKSKDREMAAAATRFCENWSRRVKLLQRLLSVVHEYHLIGTVFIFAEDANPEMPEDLCTQIVQRPVVDAYGDPVLGDDGEPMLEKVRQTNTSHPDAIAWLKKNYKGWTALRCLPPEQVHYESFDFTDAKMVELILSSKVKNVVAQASAGEPRAQKIVESMPVDVVNAALQGINVPLNTDPEAGSFVYVMENKKSDYADRGESILARCLQTLVNSDKLRQAQASIASRHMTPIRIVWSPDMSSADTDALREQVDLALQDPDYSIVSNFEVNWNEMGSDQRLLDLSSEMDQTFRALCAGLGVTEGLLTGESSYSGDRISLEVINTRYMLLRELLQDFVEEYLFKPMCARMGFIEQDEDGEDVVLYPKLSFTRLALRDNHDTFDTLFNLYQKGSLDIDIILELLNIDPVTTREKIERDMGTVNDAMFNEVVRGIYGEVGRAIGDPEKTDAAEKLSKYLGYRWKPPADPGRF